MMRRRRILAVFSFVFAIGLVISAVRSITAVKPVMATFSTMPTIVIDAGHGGEDGGAVSEQGNVIEKDINLAISLTLRDIFVANGFEVVMTRDTDISIHDEGVKGTRKQKVSDLNNRLALVNSYPNAIFLSIHQNKYTDSKPRGTQIFYSPNNPQSRELAEILQDNFAGMMQPDNNRKCKTAGKNLYLMYEATCPAVLVECGFLSNPEETRQLVDTEYQSKLAFTTFCSVMSFLGLDSTTPQ